MIVLHIIIIIASLLIGFYCIYDSILILKEPEKPAIITVNFISKHKSSSHLNAIITLFAGVVLGLGIPSIYYSVYSEKQEKMEHEKILAPLNIFVQNYKQNFSEIGDNENPYIRGKVLPINVSTKKIDEMYFDFPNTLWAVNTLEVGTFLQISHINDTIASYTNNSYSIHRSCDIKIIDLKDKKIVFEKTYSGTAPKADESKTNKGDDLGGDPMEKVAFMIKTLSIKQ